MMLLLALLAGCGDSKEDTGIRTETGCPDPVARILAPADGDRVEVGETVALEGETNGIAPVRILWGVDGDVVGLGSSVEWTADAPGERRVTLQVEDACGAVQDTVMLTVVAGPDEDTGGDTGNGGGDTGTADASRIDAWGAPEGVPTSRWADLAVGPDGAVWAAGEGGLVRLDPITGAVRVYGTADGLLSDTPDAVTVASDGTLWVGHVADSVRQGEALSVGADGALSPLRSIDFTESSEIAAVYRLREQPYGDGAGDVWMGTNEGVCVFDADVRVFAEHAHPTHPHGASLGVAFTPEGDVWNGDAYQLSRWRYSNDGDLSPSADLRETIPTWPVLPGEPVSISDLDAEAATVWVGSTLFGVARVDAADALGASAVTLLAGDGWPSSATAVRTDGAGGVWIGAVDGLYRWDGATLTRWTDVSWIPEGGVARLARDPHADVPTLWLATAEGLVRLQGVPPT
jgi:hypothetical protein